MSNSKVCLIIWEIWVCQTKKADETCSEFDIWNLTIQIVSAEAACKSGLGVKPSSDSQIPGEDLC